ncbi:hypothetical protein [Enterococcus sp. AZ012]|uniref:hypothetical protein n=1 Tax=unclassified Enterococcus TaxID=2608891 RepID=UPI003D2BABCE
MPMYNEKKIKLFKRLLVVGVILASTAIGFGLGQVVPGQQQNAVEAEKRKELEQQEKEEAEKKKTVSVDDVETFLIAYYTKRDLGENRNRYQPLMTESMFTQETSSEDLPINQAYKGYVINQVFNDATIYIDPINSTAIAEVQYHNTQLLEIGSTKGALVDTPVQETLKISFVEQGNKFLVNSIERVLLTSTGLRSSSNTYQEIEYPEDFDPDKSEESTEETQGSQETQSSEEQTESETIDSVGPDDELEGDL